MWRVRGRRAAYPRHMQSTGIVMMLLSLHLFYGPWYRFGHAVEREAVPEAARELDLAVNLVLALLMVIVGASDRFW
jgi:hypothetical protein